MMIMKRRHLVILSLFWLLTQTGCVAMGGTGQRSVTRYPPQATTAAAATVAVTPAAATLAPTVTLSPPPQGTATLTAPASAGSGDAAVISLPGIVFQNSEGTWLVEDGGDQRLLTSRSGVDVSPDGEKGLVVVNGDVLLIDFASGEESNLTEGSRRTHSYAAWWPARPGTIVLVSREPDEARPHERRLTTVEADGSNYRVVDEGAAVRGDPAPGPDGQTIAYSAGGQGILYKMDGSVEPFDPLGYGLQAVSLINPAWSPDGRRLAWVVGVDHEERGLQTALGIFDLQVNLAALVHPYRPVGSEAWLTAPVWSTGGRWLAFSVQTADPAERGLWVTNADGTVERRLKPLYYPVVWSPRGDGNWANGQTLIVALPHWTTEGENRLMVSGAWKETALVLPGAVVDWLPGAKMAGAPAPPLLETAPAPGEDRLAAPPPGLLVALGSREEGWDLALAGADGRLQIVVEQIAPPAFLPDFDVAPDGQRILYASDGDIWLLDIVTGAAENVTRTPGRVEQAPRWWPQGGAEAAFICGSRPAAMGPGPAFGYLTVVDLDGGYEVVTEEGQLAAPPAPGPDGQTIAYSRGHEGRAQPFFYERGVGETALDLVAYGLAWVNRSWEPAWSPDGRQLAWSVAGAREGVYYAAEVLLDLEAKEHRLLHTYRPQPTGDYIPAPRWAPDGSWLTFQALAATPAEAGLWWVQIQDGVARHLSPTFMRPALVRQPAVSPDGKWIAAPTIYGTGVGLIDVESQRAVTWTEEGEVAAVAWVEYLAE